MTRRQTRRGETTERVLQFFRAYVDQHHVSPTIRDISRALEGLSTSVVDYHLNKLVDEGRLNRSGSGGARTYYLASLDRRTSARVAKQPSGEVADPVLPARLMLALLRKILDRHCAAIVFEHALMALPDTHRHIYHFLRGAEAPCRRGDIADHLGQPVGQLAPVIRELGALRLIEGRTAAADRDEVVIHYHALPFDDVWRQEVHP